MRFLDEGRIFVTFDESELVEKPDQIGGMKVKGRIGAETLRELIGTMRDSLHGENATSQVCNVKAVSMDNRI